MDTVPADDRDDVVSPSRLQRFSDAVFATAAILLGLPLSLRRFHEIKDGETLGDALTRKWPQLLISIAGFQVICVVWESHVLRLKLVKKVDDFIIFFTLLSLFFTAFLPFTITLEANYSKHLFALVLPCLNLLVLQLIGLAMLMYVFWKPSLLVSDIPELGQRQFRSKRFWAFARLVIDCFLFVIAAAFSTTSIAVSWVMICLFIFHSPLGRAASYFREKCSDQRSPYQRNINEPSDQALTGHVSKGKMKQFADTVVAIVITMLIFIVIFPNGFFPKMYDVEKYGVMETLKRMWKIFVAYIGCFITICLLWSVHSSILIQLKVMTPLMILCNNIFLNSIAGIPFVYTLLNLFTGEPSYSQKIAARVSSFVIFMAGFMNLIMFVIAYIRRDSLLHSWAIPGGGRGFYSHTYLLLKTLVIPVTAFVTYCLTLGSDYVSYVTLHIFLFLIPMTFLILKIVYNCHCCLSDSFQASELDEESLHEAPVISGISEDPAVVRHKRGLARDASDGRCEVLTSQTSLDPTSQSSHSENINSSTRAIDVQSQPSRNRSNWRAAEDTQTRTALSIGGIGMTLLDLSKSAQLDKH